MVGLICEPKKIADQLQTTYWKTVNLKLLNKVEGKVFLSDIVTSNSDSNRL